MNNALPKYSFYGNPDALHIMQIWSSHLPYFSNLPSLLRSEVKIVYMDLKVLHGLSLAAFPSFTLPLSVMTLPSVFWSKLLLLTTTHLSRAWKTPFNHYNQDKIGLILPLMKGPCVIFCAYVCAPDFKTLVSDQPSTASVLLQQQKCYYGDEYCCQNTGLYLIGCIYLMPQLISPSGGRGLLLWNAQVFMRMSLDELSRQKQKRRESAWQSTLHCARIHFRFTSAACV